MREGADAIDIGGESTRPGAQRVPAGEQIARVIPVLRAIRDAGVDVPITIDTTLAEVAEAALAAGADGINDVSGGTEDPAMLRLAADRRCGIVLMHRLAPPDRDSYSDAYSTPPAYADAVREVGEALARLAAAAVGAGCEPGSVAVDPGLGFGKTVEQNFELTRRIGELLGLGHPLLFGASRKSFVGRAQMLAGETAPLPAEERDHGSVAFAMIAAEAGVRLFRVHAVGAHARALAAANRIRSGMGAAGSDVG